jgi:hypothetical protein
VGVSRLSKVLKREIKFNILMGPQPSMRSMFFSERDQCYGDGFFCCRWHFLILLESTCSSIKSMSWKAMKQKFNFRLKTKLLKYKI